MIKILLLLFFLPLITSAHGSALSFEKTVGDYFIDIGYTPSLIANAEMRFDFNISNGSTPGELPEYSNIWVRIATVDKILFAGWIHKAEFEKPGFTVVLPEKGDYELTARFLTDDDTALAEATFPFVVTESAPVKNQKNDAIMGIFTGFLLGLISAFLYHKHREPKAV